MEFNIQSFGQAIVQEAMTQVQTEKLDFIYCSGTGVQIGRLTEGEIKSCLHLELAKNPLSDATSLVDNYIVRHVALSSGLAPSLRYHTDHHTLVRVLTGDAEGKNKLVAYLLGRLFFDAMVREKDIDGYVIRKAKLHFLIDVQSKLAGLMPNWHQSLTADDEALNATQGQTQALAAMFQIEPDVIEESKAAQRALESLLRLDAIYNLRAKFYDVELKDRLLKFRDGEWEFSFVTLSALLDDLESNAIIRLSSQKLTEAGNSMIISSALTALGWQTTRISALQAKYEAAESKGRITSSSTGAEILNSISTILADSELSGKLSKDETRRLDILASKLSRDLESVTWSDRRLDVLGKVYSRQSESRQTVKVIRGVQSLKHLVESYKSAGQPVPPAIDAKLQAAIKAGLVKKEAKANANAANPTAAKAAKTKSLDSSGALGSMFANMAAQFGKKG